MNVNYNKSKLFSDVAQVRSQEYFADRIGFWASVDDVNSKLNTVDVISDTGFLYYGIPIASSEWVTLDKDFVPGVRHLPPKGARVFVLTPTKTIAGAFVICSGFARGEENTGDFYAETDDEKETKNNSYERITQSGLRIEENYTNGDLTITTNDGLVQIAIDTQDDGDVKKNIQIQAWDSIIRIDADGITLSSNKKTTINTKGDLSISAKDGETKKEISFECSKFSVNGTAFIVESQS